MRVALSSLLVWVVVFVLERCQAFSVSLAGRAVQQCLSVQSESCDVARCSVILRAEEKKNPYQDENYPDLEFVDYSDPNYVVDQGVSDDLFMSDDEKIEQMREDRRRRNDEYQFETYFSSVLKNGDEYKGFWTVYKTSTFLDDTEQKQETPRIVRVKNPLKVTSRGYKIKVETDSSFRVDGERICHEESIAEDEDLEQEMMVQPYWPTQMKALDFRGHQGNMCVGNAYTICTSVPLVEGTKEFEGPFSELRTELGIFDESIRMRVKLHFCVLQQQQDNDDDDFSLPPPLHLKSLTVCRESKGGWPVTGSEDLVPASEMANVNALFGLPGASGGLYDPPPVGSDEQAAKYMLLDLEGGATVLFPHRLDQDPNAFDGKGWVTSLDWTPGRMRYQVDRKVRGGKNLMELRTLELSEVQSADADTYRPRDGGQDMRQ